MPNLKSGSIDINWTTFERERGKANIMKIIKFGNIYKYQLINKLNSNY